MYIISSCLLGNNCKYNGGNNRNGNVLRFYQTHSCCVVCPETAGGLQSPRPPAEYSGDRILYRTGKDVTETFRRGAEASWKHVLRQAEKRREPIEGAVLKGNSPSCGSGSIYDGTFTGTTIPGDGCFVRILKEHGIEVISEKEIDRWLITKKK